MTKDKICTLEETYFGRCGSRCSWSPQSCSSNEVWWFPSPECSCDKVQVGACVKDEEIFCAVSPLSCDEDQIWLSPLDLATTIIGNEATECFLCREKPAIMNRNEFQSSNSSVQEKSDNTAMIVSSSIIGASIFIVIVYLGVTYSRRRRRNLKKNVANAPKTIQSGEDTSDDISLL